MFDKYLVFNSITTSWSVIYQSIKLSVFLLQREVHKGGEISSDITSARGEMNKTDEYESDSGKSSNFYRMQS